MKLLAILFVALAISGALACGPSGEPEKDSSESKSKTMSESKSKTKSESKSKTKSESKSKTKSKSASAEMSQQDLLKQLDPEEIAELESAQPELMERLQAGEQLEATEQATMLNEVGTLERGPELLKAMDPAMVGKSLGGEGVANLNPATTQNMDMGKVLGSMEPSEMAVIGEQNPNFFDMVSDQQVQSLPAENLAEMPPKSFTNRGSQFFNDMPADKLNGLPAEQIGPQLSPETLNGMDSEVLGGDFGGQVSKGLTPAQLEGLDPSAIEGFGDNLGPDNLSADQLAALQANPASQGAAGQAQGAQAASEGQAQGAAAAEANIPSRARRFRNRNRN